MPLVKIDLYPGRSPGQKREVAAAITQVFVEKLGSDPRDVMVIFNDTPAHDWFAAGEPMQPPAKS
ncbi:MAG: 4-oxalocrotonate tautomerase family protein [Rhizobiaceae bacterium]|nr:4-oxalocrotonate tautomerase family protein [Rhizobiaceae bacterium]